ncbi:MAG: GNAT family N-acetyltransferase [Christensenellales bacterium]
MLAHAMDQAKERGCQAVRFLVATCNIPAQRSYAKLNYEVCGECSSGRATGSATRSG